MRRWDTLYTAYDNKVSVYLCELTDYEMTYNKDEVAEIFIVPLKFFMETEPEGLYEYSAACAAGRFSF